MSLVRYFLFSLVLVSSAEAAPPAGETLDPEIHAWFERQVNEWNSPCCSLADGRYVETRPYMGDDPDVVLEALITPEAFPGEERRWVEVKKDRMVKHPDTDPNPTGHSVLWIWNGKVQCFAESTGT